MQYKLIVNQPFQSTHNVLALAIRFLIGLDPGLKRLEDYWRWYPKHIALYDSFNCIDVPVGVPMAEGEELRDYYHFYALDEWYKPHPNLGLSQLNDVLEVFNDRYGDIFYIARTRIGYGFYRAENAIL